MDNKDKTVENALDDIFGTDFIEIDDTNKHDTSKEKPLFSEDSFNVSTPSGNINQIPETNAESVEDPFQRNDFKVSTDNINLNETRENNYNEELVKPLFHADNFNIMGSTSNNGGSKNDSPSEINYNENGVNIPTLDSATNKSYESLNSNEERLNISNNEAINHNNYDFNNQINTNLNASYPENNLTIENNEASYSKDVLSSTNAIKDDKSFNKKIIIYIALGTILGLIVVFILVNFVFGIEKKELCTSTAEDTGYKYTDEYKITYKKNKINYVESTYTYTALNSEYQEQIKYVSDDKLRAIINSNGMPGFTYTYETSDNYVKVNGYLDFTLFNYDEIEKINQEAMPLSYFKISRDMTYKTLKANLEKEGYKCTTTK